MSRAFDIFLCHCDGDRRDVKLLLDYVRRDVQSLPTVGGSAPIRAFRDEDDLEDIDRVKDALCAAIRQAPIGAHGRDAFFCLACDVLNACPLAVIQRMSLRRVCGWPSKQCQRSSKCTKEPFYEQCDQTVNPRCEMIGFIPVLGIFVRAES